MASVANPQDLVIRVMVDGMVWRLVTIDIWLLVDDNAVYEMGNRYVYLSEGRRISNGLWEREKASLNFAPFWSS